MWVNDLQPVGGKEIEFTSFCIFEGERILHFTFTDEDVLYITSDSDIRFYAGGTSLVNDLPPFAGKMIEVASFCIQDDVRTISITFTDGLVYTITSDSDMRFYDNEEEFIGEDK
ncbi:hypothetical protein ACTFR8_22990 [Bacillus cereus group sp. MYBK15-3]|uniref:hypothetical protein n=1 Tax=Bacillus cereus group TaxID=86661 RepID=UPI001C8BD286|nr:hypothetical protein [Bacillus cereus]MBX9158465.1 hypothetical protein [Bacillus cereus]